MIACYRYHQKLNEEYALLKNLDEWCFLFDFLYWITANCIQKSEEPFFDWGTFFWPSVIRKFLFQDENELSDHSWSCGDILNL